MSLVRNQDDRSIDGGSCRSSQGSTRDRAHGACGETRDIFRTHVVPDEIPCLVRLGGSFLVRPNDVVADDSGGGAANDCPSGCTGGGVGLRWQDESREYANE